MRSILKVSILFLGLIFSTALFANPIVSNDVHVIKNATPAQCQSTWRGTAATETNVVVSGYGQNGMAAPAIQSCTDCAIDPESNDCVCKTCYAYSN